MALTHAAAAVAFESFASDDEVEPAPSTKRIDRRDLQAAMEVMSHIDDDGGATRTLVVSPEENRRLLSRAFAEPASSGTFPADPPIESAETISVRDADVDISDDVTVETKAPALGVPTWVFDEPLDTAALALPDPSEMTTRRSEGVPAELASPAATEPRTLRLLGAAWTVAAVSAAGTGYVLAFLK